MRKTAIALVLALLPSLAAAQVYLPPGVGLPPQSVIGNALPQTGDAVAVSFAQLRSNLNIPALKTCASHQWFNTLAAGGVLGCSQPALADISGFGALVTTFLATPTSGNLRAILPDETGTGGAVFAIGPALVNANLGTPSAAILTNASGLPISSGVSGLGTGVATALGINVGSAGAPVLFNGALGTPSSGTATNLTGLPIGTGVSGLGTGVATALAVNVGTAGAPVVNGGALGTPSSGVGTNLTALNATQLTSGTLPAARLPLTGLATMAQPSNPSGTTSATAVMMGLGVTTCRFTPTYSTRMYVSIDGVVGNATALGNTGTGGRYGTGAGPANGAAATGSGIGNSQTITSSTANALVPFNITGIITVVPGTTYWVDLTLSSSNGANSAASGIDCLVFEL